MINRYVNSFLNSNSNSNSPLRISSDSSRFAISLKLATDSRSVIDWLAVAPACPNRPGHLEPSLRHRPLFSFSLARPRPPSSAAINRYQPTSSTISHRHPPSTSSSSTIQQSAWRAGAGPGSRAHLGVGRKSHAAPNISTFNLSAINFSSSNLSTFQLFSLPTWGMRHQSGAHLGSGGRTGSCTTVQPSGWVSGGVGHSGECSMPIGAHPEVLHLSCSGSSSFFFFLFYLFFFLGFFSISVCLFFLSFSFFLFAVLVTCILLIGLVVYTSTSRTPMKLGLLSLNDLQGESLVFPT